MWCIFHILGSKRLFNGTNDKNHAIIKWTLNMKSGLLYSVWVTRNTSCHSRQVVESSNTDPQIKMPASKEKKVEVWNPLIYFSCHIVIFLPFSLLRSWQFTPYLCLHRLLQWLRDWTMTETSVVCKCSKRLRRRAFESGFLASHEIFLNLQIMFIKLDCSI